MDLYIVTVFSVDNSTSPSNIWETEKEARESLESNFFDVWEGFTNKLAVIEKMEVGCPWTCEEVAWYKHEPILSDIYEHQFHIYEVDKPEELEGLCSFGIG